MKVISLLQPWATLVVIGAKKIETRSFNTAYRGPLLIHASAGKKEIYRRLCIDEPFYNYCIHGVDAYNALPFGAIIGQVNVIHTLPSENVLKSKGHIITLHDNYDMFPKTDRVIAQHFVTEQELAFGDYSPSRYGWLLSDHIQFAQPIPAKGQLGFWNYDMPDHFHVPNKY